MIRFDRVAKHYGAGFAALDEITFDIGPGEAVVLTGHSGAGKSTLLKLIAAIERPSAGSIMVNHQDLASLRPRQLLYLRRLIGMVSPEHRLLGDRSVLDNVLLPLQIAGLSRREALQRAHAALERVGLTPLAQARPVTLADGERQRLAIARAVVNRPAILLADEPASHLDAAAAADIYAMFHAFNSAGTTLIIATHHPHLAGQLGARTLHLQHGRLDNDGTSGPETRS